MRRIAIQQSSVDDFVAVFSGSFQNLIRSIDNWTVLIFLSYQIFLHATHIYICNIYTQGVPDHPYTPFKMKINGFCQKSRTIFK